MELGGRLTPTVTAAGVRGGKHRNAYNLNHPPYYNVSLIYLFLFAHFQFIPCPSKVSANATMLQVKATS